MPITNESAAKSAVKQFMKWHAKQDGVHCSTGVSLVREHLNAKAGETSSTPDDVRALLIQMQEQKELSIESFQPGVGFQEFTAGNGEVDFERIRLSPPGSLYLGTTYGFRVWREHKTAEALMKPGAVWCAVTEIFEYPVDKERLVLTRSPSTLWEAAWQVYTHEVGVEAADPLRKVLTGNK